MKKLIKKEKQWIKAKGRIWIFIAYKDDGYGAVPFFSKLFDNHAKLKEFSMKHSAKYRGGSGGARKEVYSSTYLDLFDQTLLPEGFEV